MEDEEELPVLPQDIMKWINVARPYIEGQSEKRTFLTIPFWEDIYKDQSQDIMVVAGRQVYKSTFATDVLAGYTTSRNNISVCYVSYDDVNRNAFSNQKLRVGTFLTNEILQRFPRSGKSAGSVGEIPLKNNSTIYITTDHWGYRHVEGKSLKICVLDEAQYHEIQFLPKLQEAMTATKGRLYILGIGGESGSPYERLYHTTDQREWFFDDENWRDSLQFDENGLVIDSYISNVMKGEWIPQKPQNDLFHGYHLPQYHIATIPLTIDDAVNKYKLHPKFSIEWKKKHNPSSIFNSHVLGGFFHASRRPVTREMVERCMDYSKVLLTAKEIAEIKDKYQNKVKISLGVDFGSSPSRSATVICILIDWKETGRYQMVFMEKRPAENQMDQAEYITRLFHEAKCDIGFGDLGYGAIQVKTIQDGSANRESGKLFKGVTPQKFVGCRTIGDETKPQMRYDKKIDEHGEVTGMIKLDKTTIIQEFIDLLETKIPDKDEPENEKLVKLKLIIPSKNDWETDWLIDEFTEITRRDLDEMGDVDTGVDRRTKAVKRFNHPRDSTMSVIYALRALDFKTEWNYISA